MNGENASQPESTQRGPSRSALVDKWNAQAISALHRFYGTGSEAGHLAAVVLALIRERELLHRYIERLYPNRDATGTA